MTFAYPFEVVHPNRIKELVRIMSRPAATRPMMDSPRTARSAP